MSYSFRIAPDDTIPSKRIPTRGDTSNPRLCSPDSSIVTSFSSLDVQACADVTMYTIPLVHRPRGNPSPSKIATECERSRTTPQYTPIVSSGEYIAHINSSPEKNGKLANLASHTDITTRRDADNLFANRQMWCWKASAVTRSFRRLDSGHRPSLPRTQASAPDPCGLPYKNRSSARYGTAPDPR